MTRHHLKGHGARDGRIGKWRVHMDKTSWHTESYNTTHILNQTIESGVSHQDPSYIYIAANGGCTVNAPRTRISLANETVYVNGYIIVSYIHQQDLTICEIAGLTEYPGGPPTCADQTPGGVSCWLPLGPIGAQQTASQGADGSATVTSYYDGIGVTTVVWDGAFTFSTINCDYKGVNRTIRVGNTPYYNHPIPFGTAQACGTGRSIIDLRLTNFIIDPSQTWATGCGRGASGSFVASSTFPGRDFMTLTTNGGCSWITPTSTCPSTGEGEGFNSVTLLRMVKSQVDKMCETAELEPYPPWFVTKPSVPVGSKLCWLNLGATDKQISRSVSITRDARGFDVFTTTTSYAGIGAYRHAEADQFGQ